MTRKCFTWALVDFTRFITVLHLVLESFLPVKYFIFAPLGALASKWNIDLILSSVYYCFKQSSARRADYIRITGTSVFGFKFCKCRWVENIEVAERVISMLPHLRKYVNEVISIRLLNIFNFLAFL